LIPYPFDPGKGRGGAREVGPDTERIVPDVMQVIPRTYDLILWLVPRPKEFPRDQRFRPGRGTSTSDHDPRSHLTGVFSGRHGAVTPSAVEEHTSRRRRPPLMRVR